MPCRVGICSAASARWSAISRKASLQRLDQQLIFAPEMLVKASVRQARVPHHGRNRGAVKPSARTRREASFTIFW